MELQWLCVAIPARPVHPKDKSLVEDHVRIIYRRVFAPLRNDIFYSIEELNAAIAQKMKEHNQKLADTDLLIIDDFGVRSLDKQQMLDFMELMEDRHGMKSTIIVSQLPVANWYDMMKVNSTAADAILDRIVHTAQRFELKGDSLRKK